MKRRLQELESSIARYLAQRDSAEAVCEAVQARLDRDPHRMRMRRQMVEHPFGTLKTSMGDTHFLTRTLPRVRAEMNPHVLAYNLKRVMNILGTTAVLEGRRA